MDVYGPNPRPESGRETIGLRGPKAFGLRRMVLLSPIRCQIKTVPNRFQKGVIKRMPFSR
ncbi:hypothetical protein EDC14_1001288 [Hydrogenispora ethanolica]|uniref:Uncharacterized protein n=1 Tax=Hydrogenispora ethanolica TaxID=1082276 RepID=A0A4R1SBR4_HYDET|nr:hypothetical protein EDC14_1001288 [Hydrogenispora ethanolica]